MPSTVFLADIVARGVELKPDEAVAIVQQLIDPNDTRVELVEPLGPPSLYNVAIASDGTAVCRGSAATPAVSELGVLLQTLLPGRIPGGLRYVIARALLDVDARPFDSAAEMFGALARFQPADRVEVVARLFRRVHAQTPALRPVVVERRQEPSVTQLRKRLREADEELFRVRQDHGALTSVSPVVIPAAAIEAPIGALIEAPLEAPIDAPLDRAPSVSMWAAAAVLAAACSFAAAYAGFSRLAGEKQAAASQPIAPQAIVASTSAPRSAAVDRSLGGRGSRTPPVSTATARPRGMAADVATATDSERAFGSNGSAMFSPVSRTDDAPGTITSQRLDRGFEVMTIGDAGSRNYHAQPSPDGLQVAFDSDRDGERGVYIANRDGTGVRRVSGDGFAAVPTWSPDGRRLTFVRAEADRPHVWNLWLMSLAGGEKQRLTQFRSGQTWSASWFPDGRQVAYSHDDRLLILDLVTGHTRLFASPISRRAVRTPAVSPDGRHIVFQVETSGAWLLDVADGSMRCVLTDPTAEEFAWAPDSRRVAFHSRRDGQWGIWLMAPDEG